MGARNRKDIYKIRAIILRVCIRNDVNLLKAWSFQPSTVMKSVVEQVLTKIRPHFSGWTAGIARKAVMLYLRDTGKNIRRRARNYKTNPLPYSRRPPCEKKYFDNTEEQVRNALAQAIVRERKAKRGRRESSTGNGGGDKESTVEQSSEEEEHSEEDTYASDKDVGTVQTATSAVSQPVASATMRGALPFQHSQQFRLSSVIRGSGTRYIDKESIETEDLEREQDRDLEVLGPLQHRRRPSSIRFGSVQHLGESAAPAGSRSERSDTTISDSEKKQLNPTSGKMDTRREAGHRKGVARAFIRTEGVRQVVDPLLFRDLPEPISKASVLHNEERTVSPATEGPNLSKVTTGARKTSVEKPLSRQPMSDSLQNVGVSQRPAIPSNTASGNSERPKAIQALKHESSSMRPPSSSLKPMAIKKKLSSPPAKLFVEYLASDSDFTTIAQFFITLLKKHTLRTFILTVEEHTGQRIDGGNHYFMYSPMDDLTGDGERQLVTWRLLKDVRDVILMFIEQQNGSGVYMCHATLVCRVQRFFPLFRVVS